MTNKGQKKMHSGDNMFARALAWVSGTVEALLLARLLARLLAARPDSPSFAALYAITGPLVAPFAALDSGQPRFGAVLEISTLSLAILVPAAACSLWAVLVATGSGDQAS